MTARRREESLQDIPLAVTAFNTADMEARNIENTEDLNVLLPNVDIRGGGISATSGNFAVRGIPGVARYIDGVVMNGNVGGLESIVELERIEVLRGPQGTLFGKNAIGGAIQYVTQKPLDEFGARIKTTFGEYNRTDIVANVDIPLSDTVKTKITAAQLTRDGFVQSTTIDEAYGDEDNRVLRGQLLWEPADRFSALFTVQSTDADAGMQANVLWDVVENPPVGRDLPGTYNQIGLTYTDELYAAGKFERYTTATAYRGPGYVIETDQLIMDLNWDITDNLSLRAITNTRDLVRGNMFDMDGSTFAMFEWWVLDEQQDISTEIQLLGGGDRLDWVVGLYSNSQSGDDLTQFWQGVELEGFCGGNPIPLPPFLCPNLNNALLKQIREDQAIFFEASIDLTDALTLTVGGRSSEEDFRGESYQNLEPIGPPLTPTFNLHNRVLQQVDGVDVIQEVSFDAFTPRIALQYRFNDDVMAYVSYSEGFNAGGVNARFEPQLPNNGILPFNEELLKNFEIGVRSDLLDGRLRLNATYFDGTWEDIQVAEVLVISTTTTTNAGEAEISGFEVEGAWLATDSFSMNFALGTLDTAYTDVGQAVTIALDTPFPFAPENSYSIGLQWANDLSSGGSVMTRVDYGWIDDFETFRDAVFQASLQANNGYGLLSGRVQYTAPDGSWDVALIGTNLTDEYYRLGGFNAIRAGIDQGYVARPREVGVQFGLRF